MSSLPTLHLTNWPSRRLHGPGRAFTIMVSPRHWEHGAGVVHALVPRAQWVANAKSGRITFEHYERLLASVWADATLGPGRLWAQTGNDTTDLVDGDTLCCACAVGAPCHRRLAAAFLVRAGWRVVLDGVELVLPAADSVHIPALPPPNEDDEP